MSKKNLMEILPFFTRLEEIDEGKALPKGVIMRARGKVAHAGRITENGRLYRRSWYKRQIERLMKSGGKVEERAVIGETDHPNPTVGGPSIRRSAIIFTGLGMNDDGEVMANMDIVETEAGKDLAALVRAGAQVGFSSRARGDSSVKKMTSQDPDYELNRDWDGKEFQEVDDDSELTTFDSVIGPAVTDANVVDYHEQLKEVFAMKLEDILKDKDLLKKIAESEAFKEIVSEATASAVEAAVKKNTEELEKKFSEELMPMVKDHMESDEFLANFEVVEEGADGDDLVEAKCAECDAAIRKGDKFCPGCGIPVSRAVKPAKKEGKGDDDDRIAEMQKQLDQLKKENEDLAGKVEAAEKKDAVREDDEKVEATVAAGLEGKAAFIVEHVRADIKELKERGSPLTPDGAKEFVEAKVKKYSPMSEALTAAGKATNVTPGDEDRAKEEAEKEVEEIHESLDQMD